MLTVVHHFSEFIDFFMPSYDAPLDIASLRYYAKFEVLRRIFVILDLAIVAMIILGIMCYHCSSVT